MTSRMLEGVKIKLSNLRTLDMIGIFNSIMIPNTSKLVSEWRKQINIKMCHAFLYSIIMVKHFFM